MGMSIDTAITVLGMVEAHGICIEAKDVAVDTMRKYKQIEQILDEYCELEAWEILEMIKEVVKDVNEKVDL